MSSKPVIEEPNDFIGYGWHDVRNTLDLQRRDNLGSEGACGDTGQDNDFGVLDSLGTPPDIAKQPINKYFCNLLNAIGVKAGTDGFPAIGGTEEVSHYGKYDDSADFNSDKPVTINDPGEYAQLKASS